MQHALQCALPKGRALENVAVHAKPSIHASLLRSKMPRQAPRDAGRPRLCAFDAVTIFFTLSLSTAFC
jgi:hypothetical protein